MDCEFEEKQYEQLLNVELAGKRNILYPPGQVMEHDLGIDAAIFSRNTKFWKLWHPRRSKRIRPMSGVHLEPQLWDWVEKELNKDTFPRFKCNIFIQHKRPEYLSSRGSEYKDWGKPYYRYDIDNHQQETLEKLEEKVAKNSLVVYACPAFWKLRELWEINKKQELIENSNFVQPHKLKDHHRYTFVNAGKFGIPCSEPTNVENLNLLQKIDEMLAMEVQFENNSEFIRSLSESIKIVVESLGEDYKMGFRLLSEQVEIPQHRLGESIINILTFTFVTGTVWGVGYAYVDDK